jgi:HlyD family secretion protein
MKKFLKIIASIVALLIIAAVVYSIFFKKKSSDGTTLVEVKKGSITKKALAVGQIEPRFKFQVKSKISGIVKVCGVEVGDTVKTGDLLFEIAPDPTPQDLIEVSRNLESATSSFGKAKSDYERAVSLKEQGIIPASDLDAKKEQFEVAESNMARAKETLELTLKGKVTNAKRNIENVIKAPAPGCILTRTVNAGDPVVPLTSYQAGTELATLADMSDIIFKGTVDEIDVGKLHTGMKAKIIMGALPNEFIDGTLSKISPQARQKEGSTLFDVEIEIKKKDGVVLRAGYSSNAELIIDERNNVLLLPERLVTFEDGGKKTSVELPDGSKGKGKKTEVKLGLSDGLSVEVLSGLKEGDKVIERPPKEIK